MSAQFHFDDAARTPEPGDNAAVATLRLEAGQIIESGGELLELSHTVLEGHRFATVRIAAGEPLLSWGLPFGHALRDIEPGEYVCNAKILDALAVRDVGFALPASPNFSDDSLDPYHLDERAFTPADSPAPHEERPMFQGYYRGDARVTGTRNHLVLLGVNSRAASFVKAMEERLVGLVDEYPNVDGLVAVAHTEGGAPDRPNNLEYLLCTLAGFVVHPNVGAVIAVDAPGGYVTNALLEEYLRDKGYPAGEDGAPLVYSHLASGYSEAMAAVEAQVRQLLPVANEAERSERPVSELKIALQCGGSDAFSGISGNPLAGVVAREIVRYGGSANLAETDELIGAEPYVLARVRDLDTARRFLAAIERFKERVGWHGQTAEGNPSGGNNYRGLYNIAIKSIGAARKKDPSTRLDAVIEYGERMTTPGYYFMDSPGNDLESVAGQVASGCNLIYFVTGNGSITNFPFVPTVKIVTTTGRYNLLSRDMDVNAGRYLDGVPMEELARETLDLTIGTASGARTLGERAGHTQTSIWRDWAQSDGGMLGELLNEPEPDGEPLPVAAEGSPPPPFEWTAFRGARGVSADRVALVLPTSLCSGQVSRIIAARLNEHDLGAGRVTRFVALPHTEGCGVSAGSTERLYTRTLLGHGTHPYVRYCLLLEHGCEKTHNDYLRAQLEARGLDPDLFGWASVQLDGGIAKVMDKVGNWFETQMEDDEPLSRVPAGLGDVSLALASVGDLPEPAAEAFGAIARWIAGAGGTVVVAENDGMIASAAFAHATFGDAEPRRTIAHGERPDTPGLHVMEAPTHHWVETATGLVGGGVQAMLAHTAGGVLQSHRLVPLLQMSADPATCDRYRDDLDLALAPDGPPEGWATDLLGLLARTLSREYTPRLHAAGNTDMQFTRGLLGVSM